MKKSKKKKEMTWEEKLQAKRDEELKELRQKYEAKKKKIRRTYKEIGSWGFRKLVWFKILIFSLLGAVILILVALGIAIFYYLPSDVADDVFIVFSGLFGGFLTGILSSIFVQVHLEGSKRCGFSEKEVRDLKKGQAKILKKLKN